MSEPFLGEIIMFGGNFAPRGWALCDGQLLAISQNQALFAILGTTYGGDGRTTFGLPDLRGRSPLHEGQGPGLTPRTLGQRGGAEDTTLVVNNLPAHNHSGEGTVQLKASPDAADSSDPTGRNLALAEAYSADPATLDMAESSASLTTSNTGANQEFNNMHPYQVVNFIIAIQGIFPSRN